MKKPAVAGFVHFFLRLRNWPFDLRGGVRFFVMMYP
jgi:hypothetical protein